MQLSVIPGIEQTSLDALHAARLTKVRHVLALPAADVARVTGLSANAVRCVCRAVHAAVAARVVGDGVEGVVVTGCGGLDECAGGGLRGVVEVAGASGSGKTQLAMAVAVAVLAGGGGVVWLDSAGVRGVWERLRGALSARGFDGEAVRSMLRGLLVLSATSADEAVTALRAVRDDFAVLRACGSVDRAPMGGAEGGAEGGEAGRGANTDTNAAAAISALRVVVFDSPAAILAPVLGLKTHDGWTGHVAVNEVATALRAVSNATGATVIYTNRVVRMETLPQPGGNSPAANAPPPRPALRAALGKSWGCLPDVKVLLEPTNEGLLASADDPQRFQVQMRAHVISKRGAGGTCELKVVPWGVCSADDNEAARDER